MENQQGLSRREFTRRCAACMLGAAIAVTLGPKLAAAQGKISKSDARYQDHPKGGQQCSKCATFVAPAACKVVEGRISPSGWCMNFSD